MKISEILKVTKGKLLSGDTQSDMDLASISTDSRTIGKGEFFLPTLYGKKMREARRLMHGTHYGGRCEIGHFRAVTGDTDFLTFSLDSA